MGQGVEAGLEIEEKFYMVTMNWAPFLKDFFVI
jgi:hypothetical protein